MFPLLDLPAELMQPIFESIALSRNTRRVMRLRLVNRQFQHLIEDAIVRLRLVEVAWCLPWPRDYRASVVGRRAFLLRYLTRRAWLETNQASLLGRIRHAAVVLSRQRRRADDEDAPSLDTDVDDDMDDVLSYLQELFHLALGPANSRERQRRLFGFDLGWVRWTREPEPTEVSPAEQQADVCVAAVYLGHRRYVEALIEQGWRFCSHGGVDDVHSVVFGAAFEAAAFRGDLPMLQLLLSSNPHCRPPDRLPNADMRDVVLQWSAEGGHREAFDFALDRNPRLHLNQGGPGAGSAWEEYYTAVRRALYATPHLDIYIRAASLLEPDSDVLTEQHVGELRMELECSAMAGHVDMVRHFLEHGVGPTSPTSSHDGSDVHRRDMPLPIREASAGGSLDTVRLLLERGADPDYVPLDKDAGTALQAAARSGSLPIARVLLDAGAGVDRGFPAPIVVAVFREDMELFRMLRRYGARLDTPETGACAMGVARFYGLESMVDVLIREGVEPDARLHRCALKHERRQAAYLFPNKVFRLTSEGLNADWSTRI